MSEIWKLLSQDYDTINLKPIIEKQVRANNEFYEAAKCPKLVFNEEERRSILNVFRKNFAGISINPDEIEVGLGIDLDEKAERLADFYQACEKISQEVGGRKVRLEAIKEEIGREFFKLRDGSWYESKINEAVEQSVKYLVSDVCNYQKRLRNQDIEREKELAYIEGLLSGFLNKMGEISEKEKEEDGVLSVFSLIDRTMDTIHESYSEGNKDYALSEDKLRSLKGALKRQFGGYNLPVINTKITNIVYSKKQLEDFKECCLDTLKKLGSDEKTWEYARDEWDSRMRKVETFAVSGNYGNPEIEKSVKQQIYMLGFSAYQNFMDLS